MFQILKGETAIERETSKHFSFVLLHYSYNNVETDIILKELIDSGIINYRILEKKEYAEGKEYSYDEYNYDECSELDFIDNNFP